VSSQQQPYPAPRYSIYVLVVLLLAYILSFIDRNVLAMLVGPIRQEFEISDFQFSILHGWAFTLFYIFLGLPIGWLADRYSRKWIITGGVFFWSIMTVACGLAKNFGSLFVTRIGVGVGEAALSPPTYSLLSDYFPPNQLRWATAIFATGITIGSGTSYIVGGQVYEYFAGLDQSVLPFLGQFSAWQATFVAVGLPGLLVVLLLLFAKEPPRRKSNAHDGGKEVPIKEVIAFLKQHWQVYTALMMGVSAMSIIGYGTLTWFPEFLQRSYAMPKTEAGNSLGSIFLIAGTAGTLCGAFFATLLEKFGYKDANMRVVMLAALIAMVPAIAAPLMPESQYALLLTWPVIFIHYTHFGVAVAGLAIITPNRMRAQVAALLLFLTNLFGLALGGSFVAFFTDFVYGDDLALGKSIATVSAIMYPLAAVLIGWGLSHYRTMLDINQRIIR
jgi:MFS family permease